MKQQELEDDFWSCNVITSDDLMPSESKDLSQMTQRQLEDEVLQLAAIVNKLIGQINDVDKDCGVYIQTDMQLIAQQFEELDIRMRKNRE